MKFQTGDSVQALYANINDAARMGYSVDSGCAVSVNSGTLGNSDTLSVASGTVYFGGSSVSVSSQNVQIDPADPNNPRRDVVYIDSNGDAQVAKGTAKGTPSAQDNVNVTRFDYITPEPPSLATTDSVVLAEVWVPAGATSISSSDVSDLRIDNTTVASFETNVDAKSNDLTNLGSVSAEEASSNSTPASYHVMTDGTDILAIPQNNPADSATLSKVTDTDIGPLLEELIINQLPPQGELLEARGKILLKAGNYPGDLSNGSHDGIPLVSQLTVEGEVASHDRLNNSQYTIPTTEPPVRLDFSSRGFFAPNVNGDFMIYPTLRNVELVGPGASANGSIGLDGANSNPWDWARFYNIVVDSTDTPAHMTGDSRVDVRFCQFIRFNSKCTFRNRKYLWGTTFASPSDNDGRLAQFHESRMFGGQVGCDGSAAPAVTLADGSALIGVRFEKNGGNDLTGRGVDLIEGSVISPVIVGSQNFDTAIDCGTGYVAGVQDRSSANQTINNKSGFTVVNGQIPNGISNITGGRILINGRGYNDGDPSAGTGVWGGSGVEGAAVYDVTATRPYPEYQFVDGAWQSA